MTLRNHPPLSAAELARALALQPPRHVSVFPGPRGAGNRAVVYVARDVGAMPREALVAVARAHGAPVTAFVDPRSEPFLVRLCAPTAELPSCGHGLLAAGAVLARHLGRPRLTLHVGGRDVEFESFGPDRSSLVLGPADHTAAVPLPAALCAALGLRLESITAGALPLAVGSVGSPKALIPLASTDELETLAVDVPALGEWCRAGGVNGVYVYARDGEPSAWMRSRAFNPSTGQTEDRATGVAAAALAAVLHDAEIDTDRLRREPLVVRQGATLDDVALLCVRVLPGRRVQLSGSIFLAHEPIP